MTETKLLKFPKWNELDKNSDSKDCFTIAIKGHQIIDECLNVLLSVILSKSHHLELTRISFMLKVDIIIAIGKFSSESRPLFKKINNIRNRFAHDKNAIFDRNDINDLKNVWTKKHRDSYNSSIDELCCDPESAISHSQALLYEEILSNTITDIAFKEERDAFWDKESYIKGKSRRDVLNKINKTTSKNRKYEKNVFERIKKIKSKFDNE